MDVRAAIPVTLPRTGPTTSYWQDPPDRIADERTTETLPQEADVVVVGSGITGAAVAWNLLKHIPVADGVVAATPDTRKPSVVMLEARQACSGATGRNGGHTKAASYRTYAHHAATLGEEEAIKIAKLEFSNICAVQSFAAAHNLAVEADVNPCNTVDVIYDPEQWEAAQASVQAMRDALGEDDAAAKYELYSPEEVRDRFYCPGGEGEGERVEGGVGYFAGSLSSYRFTCGLLRMGIARGLNLQTHTPVTGLTKLDDGRWEVTTPRGKVSARKVVVATNGYTGAILPQFQGVIVPLRGQITAQRPGSRMPFGGCLPTTYSFIYEDGYEYLITRPSGSRFAGDVVVGGGLARADGDGGVGEYGTTDDTAVNARVSEYLRETTPRYFGSDNWGEDDREGRVRAEWTGIMGYSPDGYPFVGEMPGGQRGLWVSAGFQGHGMVLCWKSAEALVEMMEGRDGEELRGWFPRVFRLTKERMGMRFEGRMATVAPRVVKEGA
ncbi:FAD dependent oxidoreductase [Coniochaeta sp. 2T2.1]|nr:FAD dependent oxidoreductase [Coniochaeta sp. 2T2.1]